MSIYYTPKCPKCGKYIGKDNKCECTVKEKQKAYIKRINEMPVTSDDGCRELLAALVQSACEDYVQARLKGVAPNKEDEEFIPSSIMDGLEIYVDKFIPLIRSEEKKNHPGKRKTKCPACGGTVVVHQTNKLFRVSCYSCVCKYYKVNK